MKILLIVGIVILSIETPAQKAICDGTEVCFLETFDQCNYDEWELVFEDNFEGINLDLSLWNIVTGIARDPNFETQKAWHTPENIKVENGLLKIITKKELLLNQCDEVWINGGIQTICSDFDYTTGEINTKFRFDFGKFEARIKIPKGKGFWPAYWLYYEDATSYNEIDVFEFWNENDIFNNYDPSKLSKVHHMNVYYDFDNTGTPKMCGTKYNGDDFSQDFHLFTLIWEPNKIEWYVDGKLKRTDHRYYSLLGQPIGCNVCAFTPYTKNKIYPIEPMAKVLNLAIQHGYDKYGNDRAPDNTTPFPSQMEVDWVRFYKRVPCHDITITSTSQFPLYSGIFNFIVGENLVIDCNYPVQSNQHLDILAKSTIVLKSGFHAEAGCKLNARVDVSICNSSPDRIFLEYWDQSVTSLSENKSSFANNKIDIEIYPNPNEGTFWVDFSDLDFGSYEIKILDLRGNIISSINNIDKSPKLLKIHDMNKGPNIIGIYDPNTITMIYRNIIIRK